jgi:hypothetical protein
VSNGARALMQLEIDREGQLASDLRRRKREQDHTRSPGKPPPSNAAVTFSRETDGRLKLSWLSSVMAGMADRIGWFRTLISHATSMLCHTPISNRYPPE